MDATAIAARFAARRTAVIDQLRGVPQPLRDGFPVPVDEVLAIIDGIDDKQAIAGFADELTPEPGAAIQYEWYYGGHDVASEALGYTFATCKQPFTYSETDLVKVPGDLGVESDVVLEDMLRDEVGSLPIDRVLDRQHEVYLRVNEHYLHLEAQKLGLPMTDQERYALPDLGTTYSHLFYLKLYELVFAACQQKTERPPYVFLCLHDRWPVLVGLPS